MSEYEKILREFSNGTPKVDNLLHILDQEISLPNVPISTLGGEVFWTDLAEYNGWRVQQNMITKHARILDSNNVRIAWGTVNGMKRALNRMVDFLR